MKNEATTEAVEEAVREAVKAAPREVRSVIKDLKEGGVEAKAARATVRSMIDRGQLEFDVQMKLAAAKAD